MFLLNDCTQTESLHQNGTKISLNKVKPWVFRPKKVIYSLEDGSTTRKPFSTSHWNDEQNQKYVTFLQRFKSVIEGGKQNRRKWHLNRMMSKAIGTRSHQQCRSHHQKMMKHYQNIEGIIQHLTANQVDPSKQSQDLQGLNVDGSYQPSQTPMEQQREVDWNWNPMEESVNYKLPFFFIEEPLI